MPRCGRKQLNTNYFHIMVQGVNKEYIFNNENYMKKYQNLIFLNLEKCNIRLLAYCIMNNHAHMLIFTEKVEEMSKFMKSINTAFSMYYNSENDRVGVVFRNRYQSEPILDRQYLLNCVAYIHNNPVKAGMIKHASQYKYSSYKSYIDGSIGNQNLELVFGYKDGYMKTFDFIHKNSTEDDFIEYAEKIDYNKKIKQLLNKDIAQIILNDKMLKEAVNILIIDNKIPIKHVSENFKISRYKISKILKK